MFLFGKKTTLFFWQQKTILFLFGPISRPGVFVKIGDPAFIGPRPLHPKHCSVLVSVKKREILMIWQRQNDISSKPTPNPLFFWRDKCN